MATVFIEPKILKDGSKHYYVRSRVDDVRRSHGGFKTLREARAQKRQLEALIADNKFPEAPKDKTTLAEFAEQWLAAKKKTLKPGTWVDYELTFRLHILPALGKMELSKITPADIQSFVDSLSEKDPESEKELSPSTIHKCYRYVRNCLGNAVDKDLLDKTPCRGVIVPRPSQQAEFDILSVDEVRQVLDGSDEPERTLVAVLAYSGLRLGEALGLRWRDIGFEKRFMTVERAYGQNGWSTPKTSASRRAVPISPTLATILSEYRSSRETSEPDNVVFSHDGTTPLDQSNVRRDFNKALKGAGIRHVSLHSLRHFYASNMIASGCSIKFLQHSLGHTSATMTLNTYSHLIPEAGADSVARFDALVSGSVSNISAKKKR